MQNTEPETRAILDLESRAKEAAKQRRLIAVKSDRTTDNAGNFCLIDLRTRAVIAGSNFELTAADVIRLCCVW